MHMTGNTATTRAASRPKRRKDAIMALQLVSFLLLLFLFFWAAAAD